MFDRYKPSMQVKLFLAVFLQFVMNVCYLPLMFGVRDIRVFCLDKFPSYSCLLSTVVCLCHCSVDSETNCDYTPSVP